MYNETTLIIHHALDIIAGMAALNTVHERTIRIGLINVLPVIRRESVKGLPDSLLQILIPGQFLVHRYVRGSSLL